MTAAVYRPQHHLDEGLLLDYAAGAAPEGAAGTRDRDYWRRVMWTKLLFVFGRKPMS